MLGENDAVECNFNLKFARELAVGIFATRKNVPNLLWFGNLAVLMTRGVTSPSALAVKRLKLTVVLNDVYLRIHYTFYMFKLFVNCIRYCEYIQYKSKYFKIYITSG